MARQNAGWACGRGHVEQMFTGCRYKAIAGHSGVVLRMSDTQGAAAAQTLKAFNASPLVLLLLVCSDLSLSKVKHGEAISSWSRILQVQDNILSGFAMLLKKLLWGASCSFTTLHNLSSNRGRLFVCRSIQLHAGGAKVSEDDPATRDNSNRSCATQLVVSWNIFLLSNILIWSWVLFLCGRFPEMCNQRWGQHCASCT